MTNEWSILIYKLPPLPTRLRLSVWRRLQALGCVYLQDGVCALPRRDDLFENLQYVAAQILESEGSFHLLPTKAAPDENQKLIHRFRALADDRMQIALARLAELDRRLDDAAVIADFEKAEDDLKRERTAFLKARRLNFFGSDSEKNVEVEIDQIRGKLDLLARGAK